MNLYGQLFCCEQKLQKQQVVPSRRIAIVDEISLTGLSWCLFDDRGNLQLAPYSLSVVLKVRGRMSYVVSLLSPYAAAIMELP